MTLSRLSWLLVFFTVLVWSAIRPFDRMTWWLEVLPALLALVLLLVTRSRFPLTTLSYVLILLHCLILMVGGHYTYAQVPLGDWAAQWFDWERNNYDKLGHFAQGFVPAVVVREVLMRLQVVNGARWLALMVVCFCLAFSAFYELIEWWVALLSNEAAEAFLGTQGYVWDTQSDMAWALAGALLALLLCSGLQDRQIQALGVGAQ